VRTQEVADSVSGQMATMDQRIQQAQQSCTRAEATLTAAVASTGKVQADAQASAEQAQRRVEALAGSLTAQMDQARQQLAAALQASQEAQALVDRLEQGVFSAPPAQEGWSNVAGDPFLSCYREACEELGVLPGSGWQEVRATWRRNLMHWHPDQGGDPRLWSRRSAAYQLLVAWYEFNGAS
jgi:multidrug efflux pump subunit AcrA (membrane-fusion protein)